MTRAELYARIERLLYEELNLQDGEMMLPLKVHEVRNLELAIRELAEAAAREGVR